MENAEKSAKSSSNISEIVSKFARVCRLRSIGVFSTEDLSYEDSNDRKIDNQNNEVQRDGSRCIHVEISKLFDTISELKLAYVQLQEAHIPHDPNKIKTANELVVSQLTSLSKIKRVWKEKKFECKSSISASLGPLLNEIKAQESLLERLKLEMKEKEIDVIRLKRVFRVLDLKNRELGEELRRRKKESLKFLDFSSVQDIMTSVSKGIHDFAKPLISLMKVSGWDLDKAASAVQESVVYLKRSHKKYAFEAYIARRMFFKLSFQANDFSSITNFTDPLAALIQYPSSNFGKFCKTKYLLVVHPKMEASFFGNLDHRILVANGKHPRTPFYQAFVEMCKWVYVLQGIETLTGIKPEIFRVESGHEFSDVYMECVDGNKEDFLASDAEQSKLKVEFMVIPGIRMGKTVIRSRVYVSKIC